MQRFEEGLIEYCNEYYKYKPNTNPNNHLKRKLTKTKKHVNYECDLNIVL